MNNIEKMSFDVKYSDSQNLVRGQSIDRFASNEYGLQKWIFDRLKLSDEQSSLN